MIIGGDKTAVVKNIRKYIRAGNLNAKVEVGDPVFSDEEAERAIKNLKDFRTKFQILRSYPESVYLLRR